MRPPHKDCFTVGDLRRCAEREVRIRMRTYPGRIETGRMTADQAGREIAMMEAITQWLLEEEQAELLV
jgi:hypothetical protein